MFLNPKSSFAFYSEAFYKAIYYANLKYKKHIILYMKSYYPMGRYASYTNR